MTPTINTEHAKGVAWGLARGEPNRDRIAWTMSRVRVREMKYAASPAGVLTRAREQLSDHLPGGDGQPS